METQLAVRNPFDIDSLETAEKMAKYIAASRMFGIKEVPQAMTLMMIAHGEGQTLAQALKRFHVFDTGQLSQRADYTQGDFESHGGIIIWHVRSEEMVCASFFLKTPDDKARERAVKRFELQWELENEEEPNKRGQLMLDLARLSREGEITIIRTLADAEAKGMTQGKDGTKKNWLQPKLMLSARCVTEGIKVIDPARMAGLYSEQELSDVQTMEQNANRKPEARDLSKLTAKDIPDMKAVVEELVRLGSGESNPTVKSKLLGEAAEIRDRIAELESDDQIPGAEAVKGGEKVINESGKVIGTAVESVPLPSSQPKKPEVKDGDFELVNDDWKEYKIAFVKSAAYKGKKLRELSPEEIVVLWHKRGEPHLTSNDSGVRGEAHMIQRAYQALPKKEQK